ncbi:PTS ascorbate transporter subunit IIC [Shimazuella alba]|uniref:Ascorbate-specific PTS system EIIC component n=1 Tax=Shimazuella alba TaxID=2690964 RepID=A0A6I4VRV7_9BACL|nr:PTS ascorbate transporter subunit IIC [Shimazuella alba]MXQ52540.1 PTS ascorbate transporter subunit IIC [Shimazuella alba]
MNVLTWIANNIFGTPAILLGMIVLIGLVLQKKSTSQLITGTLKAVIGFLIINAGANIITSALNIFEPMWKEVFGITVPPLAGYLGQDAFNAKFGSAVTLAMSIGFLINVLLARFTKLKYIYLTGHMMFWTTSIFAGIVVNTVGNVSFWPLVIFLSIIMGLYWTIQPALTQPFMRKITKNDQIALGHTSASVALLGAGLGKLFGNKENDAEKLKVPKGFEFIRDSNVITALTMGVLFLIGSLIVVTQGTPGAAALVKQAGQQNFVIYSIIQSLTFAGGIAVVLVGVRMFIGELVPAFKGIATKIVPGARPALDAPVLYPYSPNAVTLGFLGTLIGAVIWLLVLGKGIGYVFVPTMIVLFFHGAAAGVFGNATGGVRGALLGGFATSTIVAWGQYLMVTNLITKTIPDTAMWAADSDMFILGPIIKFLAQILF